MVDDLPQARAALDRAACDGTAVELVAGADAVAVAGVGYWRAVEEALGIQLTVDCADRAGVAMAALRAGLRSILFAGDAPVRAKLDAQAVQLGGRVRAPSDPPVPSRPLGEPPGGM